MQSKRGGAMLDIPSLLQPVTVAAPAGPNLDARPDYLEFERIAAGKPERQIGATIVPAEPPDWSQVAIRSVGILKESKDLRVAVQFVRALLQTRSYAGLGEGLTLVRQMLDVFWDTLHPELDPEEDGAPTQRITAMMALVHRDMIQTLRNAPLVKSNFGSVSLRDLDSLGGRGEDAAAARASLEAVFRAATPEEFSGAVEAVERSRNAARELAETWAQHLGHSAVAVDFDELLKVLAQANSVMKERLAERQPASAAAVNGVGHKSTRVPAETSQFQGEVRTREDVVRALEHVCAYYARNEPSSPVPMLLERCKRLATMSFLEIVKDMMPDGLTAVETIAGKQDPKT
jgi:type VI secretion system protein ImpA